MAQNPYFTLIDSKNNMHIILQYEKMIKMVDCRVLKETVDFDIISNDKLKILVIAKQHSSFLRCF